MAEISLDDIRSAADRLEGVATITPIMTSATMDALTQARILLKCENFQRTGSFKFRGAYNTLSKMSLDRRAKGVLTYSSGNHAQALALSGKLLDVPVTVVMPSDAPRVKVEATRGYGAEVIEYSRDETTREELAASVAKERSLPIIPPYDHPDIVAGQGTVGLELISSFPRLDVLLVCCGGGGLLSGCAIAVKSTNPETRVIGVEPEAADDATRSFQSGQLVTIRDPETIADGARTPSLGAVTFPLILRYVDKMVTVSEDEIISAMRFLWERLKIVVEPTGALAVAAILSSKIDVAGKQVGAVISGGNVDLKRALYLLAGPEVSK